MHIFPFHENSLNPFQRWMIIESKAEGRVPDYVLGRKYTYIRARSHKQDFFVRRFFFSCPSVSRIPSTEKTRIENTGESCETMQGTSCLKGKERGGDGGGKGEREKKKRKKKYAEQRRKLVIELAGCGKCGVKNTVESRRPSQVFTGTLWNSFERMKLLSNAPLQPTDDMQPTGLESN